MKFLRRLGITVLILIIVLVLAALWVPVLFKSQITEFVKKTINDNVEATVDFDEVSVSFFRRFPKLDFRLTNFEVLNAAPFDSTYLLKGKNFDVAVYPLSALRPPIRVAAINLDDPTINVVVLEDGQANYDIFPESETTTTTTETGGDLSIELQSYTINNGSISYQDATLDFETALTGLNHTGKGNFTLSIFDLATKTTIEEWTIRYGGVKYLNKAQVRLDATLNANLDEQKYTLKENALYLNDLQLHADGYVQLLEEAIAMDLKMDAPENDFKHLISLLPNVYTEEFGDIKAAGAFDLKGMLKGEFISTETITSYPAFAFELQAVDGSFQYPGLPLPVQEINTNAKVSNAGGDLDNTIVDIQQFKMQIANEPIEGYFKLKTPLSDPDVDTKINGKLDLEQFAKAYPLEGVKELRGKVGANIQAKAKYSQIEQQALDKIAINGRMQAAQVVYEADGLPEIKVPEALVSLDAAGINIKNLQTQLGKSDLNMSGNISNPFAYFTSKGVTSGKVQVRSNYFNVDEWMSSETTTTTETTPTTATTTAKPVGDLFNFDVDTKMKKIEYANYTLFDLNLLANSTANDLKVQQFSTIVNGSDIRGTGNVGNLYDFLFAGETLTGAFDLSAGTFDLDQLMATPEEETTAAETTTAAPSTAAVPDYKYDLAVKLAADKIVYSPYTLQKFSTTGQVSDQTIRIDDFKTLLYDSDLAGKGTLSNYLAYVFAGDTLSGRFDLRSNLLNLNPILASEDYTANIGNEIPKTAEPEDLEVYILPTTWDFVMLADAKKVLYTDLELQNMKGKLTISEGRLFFEETQAAMLGGKINVEGDYDTQNPEKPFFELKLGLEDLSIPTAFNTFNSFQALAPVGNFVEGKMNTTLLFSSMLGQDMMPDLKTINMQGFIQTMDAAIKRYQPLTKVGQLLGTDLFNEVAITDSKNWFIVEDGTIKLEEAKFNLKDADFTVSGTYTLDQKIDYQILASIPRTELGNQANKGLNLLESKASELGLNLSAGTHVNMRINLTGAATDPKINIVPIGTENRSSVKEVIKSTVDEEIKDVKKEVKEEVDEQIADARSKVDATIADAKKDAQAALDSVKNSTKDEAEKVIQEEIDEIKDKLNKFNPFKKKKKGN